MKIGKRHQARISCPKDRSGGHKLTLKEKNKDIVHAKPPRTQREDIAIYEL